MTITELGIGVAKSKISSKTSSAYTNIRSLRNKDFWQVQIQIWNSQPPSLLLEILKQ